MNEKAQTQASDTAGEPLPGSRVSPSLAKLSEKMRVLGIECTNELQGELGDQMKEGIRRAFYKYFVKVLLDKAKSIEAFSDKLLIDKSQTDAFRNERREIGMKNLFAGLGVFDAVIHQSGRPAVIEAIIDVLQLIRTKHLSLPKIDPMTMDEFEALHYTSISVEWNVIVAKLRIAQKQGDTAEEAQCKKVLTRLAKLFRLNRIWTNANFELF